MEKELLDILQRWYLNNLELKMDVDFMRGVTRAQLAEIKYLIKEIHEKDIKAFEELIGEDTDIAKVINPYGTGAGQSYPGLIDVPSQPIVHALEGINQYKAELRTKLDKYRREK